jgi:WD40 repeat protein
MRNTNKLLTALVLTLSFIIIGIGTACKQNADNSEVKPQVAETGEPRLVVQSKLPIRNAVFSKDSKLLATSDEYGSVVILDVATGRELRNFSNNSAFIGTQDPTIVSLGFSTDGKILATHKDGIIRIWNIYNGNLIKKIELGKNEDELRKFYSYLGKIEFLDDQKNLKLSLNETELKVEIGSGKIVSEKKISQQQSEDYYQNKNKIKSSDGKFIAKLPESSTDKDTTQLIELLDAQSGKLIKKIESPIKTNYETFFSDNNLISVILPNYEELEKAKNSIQFDEENRTMKVTENKKQIHFILKNEVNEDSTKLTGLTTGGNLNVITAQNGKLLAFASSNGVEFIDTKSLKRKKTINNFSDVSNISQTGKYTVNGSAIWDVSTNTKTLLISSCSDFEGASQPIAFSQDDRYVIGCLQKVENNFADGKTETQISSAIENNDENLSKESIKYAVWNLTNYEKTDLQNPSEFSSDISSLVFSPSSEYLAIARSEANSYNEKGEIEIWDAKTGKIIKTLSKEILSTETLSFSPDGKLLISGGQDRIVRVWDVKSGQQLKELKGHSGDITSVKFSQNGRLILSQSTRYHSNPDGTTKLWDAVNGKELLQMVKFQNGDWIVTTPDGRFDTNNLDKVEGMHWIMPSEPLRPLPIEIFMRQYYEPKLLARVLKCNETNNCEQEFKPLPSLNTLNRTQPSVKITEVKPDSEGTAEVTVEVANTKSEGQKDTFGNPLESGVNDVRLFRDGQLVGYAPKTNQTEQSTWEWLKSFVVKSSESASGKVELDQDGKATLKFSKIKLPKTGIDKVEFSAYAFNIDQIKSETSRQTYEFKASNVKGRAYIISMGVNANEKQGSDLRFAANDARQSLEILGKRLIAQGQYEEVVNIPLISDFSIADNGNSISAKDATAQQVKTGQKTVTENTATKAHFKAVLDILAGRKGDTNLLKTINNADKLRQANPEDLIIFSVSSHGSADKNGIFYLLASDGNTISSDELSVWLRDVDGGELALIIDACHSASAVETADFKPAPMNSRGLGQLSYDKGMRILTATQADNVALETNKTRQGLLSYALLQNGLNDFQADFKPQDRTIVMSEWLNFGVERVPRLWDESQTGQVKVVRETKDTAEAESQQKQEKTQQPSLFDFSRKNRDVTLEKRGGSVPNPVVEAPKIIQPISTPTPSSSSSPTTSSQTFNGRVIKTDCRIRENPTTDANIIGKLNYNDPINIVEQRGRWFRITTATGLQGWMDGDLIEYNKQ